MDRTRSYSQLGSLALVLFVGSVLLTTSVHAPGAGPVTAAVALWGASFAVSIAAIVRDRGQARLLPAYVTMVLCVLGLVAAVPTFLLHKETSGDTRAAIVDSQTKMRRLEAMLRECSAQRGQECDPMALAAMPEAIRLGVRLGTGCVDAGDVCLSQGRDGSRSIEQVTREITGVGPLRVTTIVSADRAPRITCVAVRPNVSATRVAQACGPGVG